VCDPTTLSCVGCLSKADCAAPTPACDDTTQNCVACTANEHCAAPAPFCDIAHHACVACLQQTDCPEAGASRCDQNTHTCAPCSNSTQCNAIPGQPICSSGTCVECAKQTDCKSATASRCDPTSHTCKACTADADCGDIEGKNVCLAGECVQCTAAKPTACGTDTASGSPYVCDSLKHTCTTQKAKSADLCEPCVSDAQCKPGELCVLDTLGAGATAKTVGYFCHWKKGDETNGAPTDCLESGRPYAGTLTGVNSIDGQTADICSLAVSSCPANSDFRSKNCAPGGTPDDSLCGVAAPVDAKCIQAMNSSAYRCTMRCLSSEDCPAGSSCNTSRGVCQF
jgi:hypothetical protein